MTRSLVWRAAGRLGIARRRRRRPAVEAGLVEFGARVRFRHPLVRSAAYRSASARGPAGSCTGRWPRRPIRRLTRTGGPGTGPRPRPGRMRTSPPSSSGRRAGRRPAAGWPRPRRSWSARCALTADPARRAGRTLAAAQASLQAGAFGKALELLAMAEAGPLDELQGARVDLLRGQIAFASSLGSDAPSLLLKAARRLEPLDLDLARETYLNAWSAALFAGHLAGAGDLLEVSRAAQRPSPLPGSAAPGRPAAGRPGAAGHRRPGRRGAGAAAGGQRLCHAETSPGDERTPVGLDGRGGRLPCGTTMAGARSWRDRSSSPVTSARSTSCRSL